MSLQFRVDVFDTSSDPEIRPYIPGTPLSATPTVTLPYPLKLYPRQRNDYFVPPQSFNILGMFQNPMMLMMVGVGAMALLMPYLMVSLATLAHIKCLCQHYLSEKHGPGVVAGLERSTVSYLKYPELGHQRRLQKVCCSCSNFSSAC